MFDVAGLRFGGIHCCYGLRRAAQGRKVSEAVCVGIVWGRARKRESQSRCWIMSTLEREGRWRDKKGPKWPASAREKGNRGREDRYGPKWPAPLGYVGCVTGTDPNGRLLSGGRGVEGQKRTQRAGSCQGKRDGSGKTGTDLNGRHLLCFTFIDFQAT